MQWNLYDYLFNGKQDSAAVALRLQDEVQSYAQLASATGHFLAGLRALGVQPGDRVALQVGKSLPAIHAYLACQKLGAIYLPLNSDYTQSELAHFLTDATPVLFIVEDAETARMQTAFPEVRVVGLGRDFIAQKSGAPSPERDAADFSDPDRIAAILYTSGTTGRPKGAMITARNLISNTDTLIDAWGITAKDRLIHALPIFHAHGLFVALNTVLRVGGEVDLLARFDLEAVLALLPGATLMMGVPTFYERLADSPLLTPERAAGMRLFISGSAPLRPETHERFRRASGHMILERYGMTETIMITSNPLVGARKAGTVGLPLHGIEVRLADPATGVSAAEDVGVLQLRGPNVFKGYWNLPEKTKAEFTSDGFFITGDMARRDLDGYISIVGRNKDMIISGGYNVYPREIEQVIDRVAEGIESAIIGAPHPDFGEGVVAVVAAKAEPELVDRIAEACRAELARYKQPKKIIVVEELPRNGLGKVQKNVLRELHKEAFTLS